MTDEQFGEVLAATAERAAGDGEQVILEGLIAFARDPFAYGPWALELSASDYAHAAFADRSHLKLMDVPTKSGGTVKRWMNPNKAPPGAKLAGGGTTQTTEKVAGTPPAGVKMGLSVHVPDAPEPKPEPKPKAPPKPKAEPKPKTPKPVKDKPIKPLTSKQHAAAVGKATKELVASLAAAGNDPAKKHEAMVAHWHAVAKLDPAMQSLTPPPTPYEPASEAAPAATPTPVATTPAAPKFAPVASAQTPTTGTAAQGTPLRAAQVKQGVQAALKELSLYRENRDGVIELRRIYPELKKSIPDLSVEEFHAAIKGMAGKNGDIRNANGDPGSHIEQHVLNEVQLAQDRHLSINENDRMYYYARQKPEHANHDYVAEHHAKVAAENSAKPAKGGKATPKAKVDAPDAKSDPKRRDELAQSTRALYERAGKAYSVSHADIDRHVQTLDALPSKADLIAVAKTLHADAGLARKSITDVKAAIKSALYAMADETDRLAQ